MPDENPASQPTPTPDAAPVRPAASPEQRQVLVLVVLVALLLGILAFMAFKRPTASPESRELMVLRLKTEAEALRADLNRQREQLGLQPRPGEAEPVEQISERVKKDVETLMAVASRFQNLLAEKDRQLDERSVELLRAEQMRKEFADRPQGAADAGTVETQRQRIDQLQAELEQVRAQRDALAEDLETSRREAESRVQNEASAGLADLQRQLEETRRAKDFFENRVRQLEAGDGEIPAVPQPVPAIEEFEGD